MLKVFLSVIISFSFLIVFAPEADAQSCGGTWACRLYEWQCSGTCQDPSEPGCSDQCVEFCPANFTNIPGFCSSLNQSQCGNISWGNPACCSANDVIDNCSWQLPACGSHNCFTGPCESGNGCQCWGVCSGSTCRHTSQVDPSCGSVPPTATPTAGPSCTYGSCSTPGAVTGSSDPNGYYSCDGTCWQWVNCPAGQTFNGSGCSGVGTPTPTSGGAPPTPTDPPSCGACGCDAMQCGGAGACWPLCCSCSGSWADCSACVPSCSPNGTSVGAGNGAACCTGYESGGTCQDVPSCSGCQTWNGSACQDNNGLCPSGQQCSGGACIPLTYTISGTVFIDTDQDGNRDGGESGYQGATVVISPGGSHTSSSTGFYSRSGLLDGNDYTVTFTVPNGYTATNSTTRNFNNLSNNQTANFGIISIPVDCSSGLVADQNSVNPGGLVNLSLSGCTGVEDPPNGNPPPPFDWDPPQDDNPADEGTPQCSDGVDNDGDTLVDTNDPRCHWDGDASNPGSYDQDDDNESPADSTTRQCADGTDNDGDGLTDIADPECHTDGNPDSDGDDVPDNNDGSYNPGSDNESDWVAPGESGSTTCSDAELNVVSGNSTSSNATWTAHSCPAFQQVCTVTAIANGTGGSDTNTANITVLSAGIINVDIRDVSDGSACDASAPLLTDEATIGLTGGIITTETVTDGSYSFTCLPNGNYNVSLGLPPGYQMASGTTVQATTITDANKTRDIRFCVVNFNPWFQTTTGDVRMRGIVNPIPAGLVGSTDASNPSVFFSTQTNASVETGGNLSAKNWLVNREYAYNSLTRNRNGVVAYSFYKNRAKQEGTPIIELASGTLDNNNGEIIENGVYEWTGDMTINGYSHVAERAVILVNGNVTIESEVDVPAGSLLIVAASGNITVDANVGQDSTNFASTVPHIEGIYSAHGSITLEGTDCSGGTPDRRLNVEGALIANSLKPFASDGGGVVQNQRSLCLDDDNYPSLYVSTRADFLTKLTDFYKVSYTKWREVNP